MRLLTSYDVLKNVGMPKMSNLGDSNKLLAWQALLKNSANMCNASFAAGVLPASQKHAIVISGLEKPTLNPDDVNSYKPIFNLCFISNTIERVVAARFNEHGDVHKLLPICQSADRACHSTETAVTIVHNNIVRNIEQKDRVSMLVLLDLSAAFDTVDHVLILEALEKRFGIHGMTLTILPPVSDRSHSDISRWAGKVNYFRRELRYSPRFGAGPNEIYCLHRGPSGGD